MDWEMKLNYGVGETRRKSQLNGKFVLPFLRPFPTAASLSCAPARAASHPRPVPEVKGKPAAGSPLSNESFQARPGRASRPVRTLVPAGSARPCLGHRSHRDHSGSSGCQTGQAFPVGGGDSVQVAMIQGGAFFPSGSTHRPPTHPRPRKGHAHKKLLLHY
jgi:hypothetical protein